MPETLEMQPPNDVDPQAVDPSSAPVGRVAPTNESGFDLNAGNAPHAGVPVLHRGTGAYLQRGVQANVKEEWDEEGNIISPGDKKHSLHSKQGENESDADYQKRQAIAKSYKKGMAQGKGGPALLAGTSKPSTDDAMLAMVSHLAAWAEAHMNNPERDAFNAVHEMFIAAFEDPEIGDTAPQSVRSGYHTDGPSVADTKKAPLAEPPADSNKTPAQAKADNKPAPTPMTNPAPAAPTTTTEVKK